MAVQPRGRVGVTLLPRASSLDLASACLYPWTSGLPWSDAWTGAHTDRGTSAHAAAALLATGQAVDLSTMPESVLDVVMRIAEVLDRDQEAGARVVAVEVGVAYDLDRRAVRRTTDDEPPHPWEYRGHIDAVLRRADGATIVRDWKTGPRAMRGRVEDSMQVLMYAVCAAELWPSDRVIVELAHVGAGTWIDSAELHPMDLGAARGRLREIAERVRRPALPVLGPHCRDCYCPIAAQCPAGRELAARVAREVALPLPDAHAVESDEMAADILERLPLAEAYIAALRAAAEAYVARVGVVTSRSGARWGVVEQEGAERLQLTPEAEAVLASIPGAIEVERSATKASIERALRSTGKGWTKRLREVVSQLREVGALRRGAPWQRVEVIR